MKFDMKNVCIKHGSTEILEKCDDLLGMNTYTNVIIFFTLNYIQPFVSVKFALKGAHVHNCRYEKQRTANHTHPILHTCRRLAGETAIKENVISRLG